jgi:predicted transcriptional regulator
MEARRVLHSLVDELPDQELVAAKRFLQYLRSRGQDSFRAFLEEVPLDDEPVSEEDLTAIREGLGEKARGEVISQEEAERLLLGSR